MTVLRRRQKTRLVRTRKKERVIVFHYALYGLDTSVADWYVGNERDNWNLADWAPNHQWNQVRLRRCDIPVYLRALNRYLRGCWTPNQGFGHGTCGYNGAEDIASGQSEMNHLEALADRSPAGGLPRPTGR